MTPESKCLTAVNVRTDGAELQSGIKRQQSLWTCVVHLVWFLLHVGDIKEPTTLFAKTRGRNPWCLRFGFASKMGHT